MMKGWFISPENLSIIRDVPRGDTIGPLALFGLFGLFVTACVDVQNPLFCRIADDCPTSDEWCDVPLNRCRTGPRPEDAGVVLPMDAEAPDAGFADADRPDLGPPDTGVIDMGVPDSGPVVAGVENTMLMLGYREDTFLGIRVNLPEGRVVGFGLHNDQTVNASFALYSDIGGRPGDKIRGSQLLHRTFDRADPFVELSIPMADPITAGDYWIFCVMEHRRVLGANRDDMIGNCDWRDTTKQRTKYSGTAAGMPANLENVTNCNKATAPGLYIWFQES